jgi:hypothetical protein
VRATNLPTIIYRDFGQTFFGALRRSQNQVDEPDDAQPKPDGYGPCIPPAEIVRRYEKMRATVT